MYQIRIHGHDREHVIATAELIASAATHDGRHAAAYPGTERTDGHAVAYCRIDDAPIRSRQPVDTPDAILVLDPALITTAETLRGLRPGGLALVDSPGPVNDPPGGHVVTVPASEIASAHTAHLAADAPMLAAFAAASRTVSLVAVRRAITDRFPGSLSASELASADCAYERLQSTGPFPLNPTDAIAAVMEAHHAP